MLTLFNLIHLFTYIFCRFPDILVVKCVKRNILEWSQGTHHCHCRWGGEEPSPSDQLWPWKILLGLVALVAVACENYMKTRKNTTNSSPFLIISLGVQRLKAGAACVLQASHKTGRPSYPSPAWRIDQCDKPNDKPYPILITMNGWHR